MTKDGKNRWMFPILPKDSIIGSCPLFSLVFFSITLAQTLAQSQVPTEEHIIDVLSKAPDGHKALLQLGAEAAPAMAECLPLAENPATLLSVIEELNNPAAATPMMKYIKALSEEASTDAERLLIVRSLDVLGQIGDRSIEKDIVALMDDARETEPSVAIHAARTIGCIGTKIRRKEAADYIASSLHAYEGNPRSPAMTVTAIELSIAAASLSDDQRFFNASLESTGPNGTRGARRIILSLMSNNLEKRRFSETQAREFLATVTDSFRESIYNDPFLDYELNLARSDVLVAHREKLSAEMRARFREALMDWRSRCLQSVYAESQAYQEAVENIDAALLLLSGNDGQ